MMSSSLAASLIEPTLHHILCPDAKGAHRVAYWQFLPPNNAPFGRTAVAVHGLTRNARDFGVLLLLLLLITGKGD